jgi:hypothetical protein
VLPTVDQPQNWPETPLKVMKWVQCTNPNIRVLVPPSVDSANIAPKQE